MKLNKIATLAIIVLAAFLCLNVASAGLFDFLGGGEPEIVNETYTLDGFSVVLPKNTSIINFTLPNNDGVNGTTYYIQDYAHNNTTCSISVGEGSNLVTSIDDYVQNMLDKGAIKEANHGNWTVLNVNNYRFDDGSKDSGYVLAMHEGSRIITISGEDLGYLQNLSDTYKKV